MLNKIKSFFQSKAMKPLETVSLAGHTFKVIDPFTMPKIRQAAIYLGEYEREWGMTKDDLLAYDDIIAKETNFPTEYIGESDLTAQLTDKLRNIYNLIDTRRLLIQEDFQYKPFLKAACHMILMDNEDINNIDPNINDQKMMLCDQSEQVMLFFLRTMKNFQNSIAGQSNTSGMLEFLPQEGLKIMEKRVLTKIQQKA